LPQKGDSLRKCPSTGRLKPRQVIRNPTQRPSQKGDSLREMFPNRKTKTQTGKLKFQTRHQKPNRKICPGKDSPIVTNNRKTETQTGNQRTNRRTNPRKETH